MGRCLIPVQCCSCTLHSNFEGLRGLFRPGVHLDTDCDGRLRRETNQDRVSAFSLINVEDTGAVNTVVLLLVK